jgi:hypothetical protein
MGFYLIGPLVTLIPLGSISSWAFKLYCDDGLLGISPTVVFIASRGSCYDVVHLEPYTWVGATIVFLNGGYLIILRCRENAGKLLTAPRLADGA